ncbi:transposase [Hymenobacter sp. 102]|uniref:transposase n=1 Tax=Hymenobacter sp. 102 TaxID=3403152 RepID=UPI003CFAA1FC
MSRGCAAKKSLHASERDTERVRASRRQHVEAVAQCTDVHRCYFLDETGVHLDYCRRYARAVGGRRAAGAVRLKRGKSLTLIGVLGAGGLTAVQVLGGALNRRSFAFYVGRVLGPQLRRGDVLVLDNLPVHKLSGLQQELVRSGVEMLFLPPYSP